ncbi:MAG: hypothetical protein LUG83_00845, partial [Lachnospiraceae bacterium]|nr:hypothetical protein [Lachnospiraceae bacterium]
IYYWLIATYNPEVFEVNLSTVYLAIWLLISVVIMLTKRVIVVDTPKSFVIFVAVCFAYIIPSESVAGGFAVWLKLFMPFMLLLVMNNLFKDNWLEKLNKLVVGVGVSNLLACAFGALTYFTGNTKHYTAVIGGIRVLRMTGSFQQANVLGSYIAISFVFGVYVAQKLGRAKKPITILVILVNAVCLILTFSRWAIISVIVAAIIYFLTVYGLKSIKIRKSTVYIRLAAILFFVIVVMFNFDSLWSQIQIFFIHEGSTEARSLSMISALKSVANNLFLGIGMGNLPANISILDSTIMTIFVNTGVLGAAVYVFFCIQIGRNLLNALQVESGTALCKAIYISYIVFMFNSLAESVVYNVLINSFLSIYVFASLKFGKRIDTILKTESNLVR